MSKHYRTDFENMSLPQLESVHNGIDHQVEELQMKMAADMGRVAYLDIHPRNYDILPMDCCSLHDQSLLTELCERAFDCAMTIEQKKAEAKNDMENFHARFQFWGLMNELNDHEQNQVYLKCQALNGGSIMTSHEIIERLKVDPDFLDQVVL